MKIALPNGLTFHAPTDEVAGMAKVLFHEVFVLSRYERAGFEIRRDDTVVDIGANMGMFTLWAASRASNGRIIAVEPTPAVELLRLNVERNNLDNVEVVHAAVGDDDTTSDFVYYPSMSALSLKTGFRRSRILYWLMAKLHDRSKRNPVTVTSQSHSLKTILCRLGIDCVNYLKMDCEGGEYDIIRNMDSDDWRRVDKVAMEFHQFHRSHDFRTLLETFQRNGFQIAMQRSLVERLFRHGEIWASKSYGP